MRKCSKCGTQKPLSHFHKNKSKDDGLHTYCKSCQRRYALLRTYGITLEQYQELLDKQDGCCAICKRHHSHFKTALAVEHDHRTGYIRGLCCSYCNRGLAAYHDKSEYFRRAADYLEQHTGLMVPPKKKKRRKRSK